jgi:ABC-type sugar transport system ATPase subunit
MAKLLLENLSKTFAGPAGAPGVTAVDRFSLDVHDGKLLVLLGPSGCGKTTLLRLIAGLDEPSSGRILLDGQELGRTPAQKRPFGMASQYPALLPQLSVRENIALGPKLRGVPGPEREARVRNVAGLLRITELLDRSPETLSGGQQQRVSLARALAREPAVLLLDEPLANLDPVSRSELRDAVRSAQQQLQITTLYVTHDQAEAAAIADEIAIMNCGAVQQVGTAQNLYCDPSNLFVAEFFDPDRPNIFSAVVRAGRLCPRGANCDLPVNMPNCPEVTCVLRSGAITPGGSIRGEIKRIQHTGWATRVILDLSGVALRAVLPFSPHLKEGQECSFGLRMEELFFFDAASGDRLRG